MDKSELLNEYKKYGYVIQEKIFNKNEILRMRKEANDILELIFNSSNEFKRKSTRFDLVSIDKINFMVRKIYLIIVIGYKIFNYFIFLVKSSFF